jgi:hypothetical protein
MEDDHVVSEVPEFEILKCRHRAEPVVLLPEDAERENEDGILRIDGSQSVIAALVDIHDVVAVLTVSWLSHAAPPPKTAARVRKMGVREAKYRSVASR